jgi:hypothetical protein
VRGRRADFRLVGSMAGPVSPAANCWAAGDGGLDVDLSHVTSRLMRCAMQATSNEVVKAVENSIA